MTFFTPLFHHMACGISAIFLLLASAYAANAEIDIVDVTGRQVKMAAPAKRILLSAMAYYPALSLLSRNAPDLVVGIGGLQNSPSSEADREVADKPRLGSIWDNSFSIEKALALQPDLMIATNPGFGQSPAVEAAFAKAGVPILYVDFFLDPARNTVPSMEIIGRAIGEEKKAAEFGDLYRSHVDRVSQRLAGIDLTRPKILINSRRPGLECCWAMAKGSLAAYFDRLGVNNVAAGKVPGEFGQLSIEYVIESDPEIFIASDLVSGPGSLFGEPRTVENGVTSLKKLTTEIGLSELAAMRDRRVHVIDVSLLRSPLNILALEVFAKWIHPELFADLAPQATLDEINERFFATPLRGPFWASLDDGAERATDSRP